MGVIWIMRTTLANVGQKSDPDSVVLRDVAQGKRKLFAVSRTDFDIQSLARVCDEFKLKPIVVGGQESYTMAADLAAKKIPVILSTFTTRTGTGAIGPESTELSWNQAGILHKAGVTVAIADGNLLSKAAFAVRAGLSPQIALESITKTPATLLGIDNRVGSIEVGKDADLVATTGDPFQPTSAIQWVMVDGKTTNAN